ncbi:MAG: putative membrane-anchored protein [Cyclobacteriaceae bacterium]|jgi:uncharacterized membrane-anchored protein
MIKTLKITLWIFVLLAIVFFWISIRSAVDQVTYSLLALVAIAGAFVLNKLLKKYEEKDQG